MMEELTSMRKMLAAEEKMASTAGALTSSFSMTGTAPLAKFNRAKIRPKAQNK